MDAEDRGKGMSTDALSLSRDRLASAYKDFQEDPEPNFKRLAPGRKAGLNFRSFLRGVLSPDAFLHKNVLAGEAPLQLCDHL